MSDEKPNPLEGEYLPPSKATEEQGTRLSIRDMSFVQRLELHWQRKRVEANTQLKRAMTDNVNATAELEEANRRWMATRERLSEDNIEDMRQTVRINVRADRVEAETRLEEAQARKDNAALNAAADKYETIERLQRAKAKAKRWKNKGSGPNLSDQIAGAEKELNDLFDEIGDPADGRVFTVGEEERYSRKVRELEDRIDHLREKKRKQDEDDL